MESGPDAEFIRRGFALWSQGVDVFIDAFGDAMDPDLEVDFCGYSMIDLPPTFQGRDSFFAFLRDWRATFDEYEAVPTDITQHGDDFVVMLRERARGKGSGVALERDLTHIWTIRPDRTFVRWRAFRTKEEAIEALRADEG